MKAAVRFLAVVALCGLAALSLPLTCPAQPMDRKAVQGKRRAMIDWAERNGVVLKGMTKNEVLKIYGFPDKKYSSPTEGGRMEKWTYYHPRRRSIFPFKRSPFASRYRFLYFKNDVLFNFEN